MNKQNLTKYTITAPDGQSVKVKIWSGHVGSHFELIDETDKTMSIHGPFNNHDLALSAAIRCTEQSLNTKVVHVEPCTDDAEILRAKIESLESECRELKIRVKSELEAARDIDAEISWWKHCQDCPRQYEYEDHHEDCDGTRNDDGSRTCDGNACWVNVTCGCGLGEVRTKVELIIAALSKNTAT